MVFGCPGWLQGLVQADYYLKGGWGEAALVIGAEELTAVYDPHDVDGMIYSDGAGAAILKPLESSEPFGILSHRHRSDTHEPPMLRMGPSYNPAYDQSELFIKMDGHDIYRYASRRVPEVVKDSIAEAGLYISDISKILVHQANEKLDNAILNRLFRLYNADIPSNIMPMTIAWLGNNSVATIPIMLDLIMRGEMPEHSINPGEYIVMASVGAGMNINSVVYRIPQ
jgi:3-oxoacyl-[acyl-carrier-protein] synthase-3